MLQEVKDDGLLALPLENALAEKKVVALPLQNDKSY